MPARIALLVLLALAAPAAAQTVVWTGGGDGSTWSDGANWDTGAAPEAGDDAVIDVSASVTVDNSPTVASLRLANSGASLDVATPLEVTGETAITDGFLAGSSRLRTGTLTWTGGTMFSAGGLTEVTGAATITGGTGGPFAVPGRELRDRRLTLNGTTALAGFIDLRGGTVEVGASGEVRLAEDSGIASRGFGGGGTIENRGTIVRTGTNSGFDESQIGAGPFGQGQPSVLINTGTITAETGEINVYPAAGSLLDGTFRADSPGALSIQDPAQNATTVRDLPATLTGSGRLSVWYGYELTGTLSVTGFLSILRGASIGAGASPSGLGTLSASGNGDVTRIELPGTLSVEGFTHSFSDLELTPDIAASGDVSLQEGGTLRASPAGITAEGDFQFFGSYTAEAGGDLVARGPFEAVEGFEGPGSVLLTGRDLRIEAEGRVTNSEITLAGGSEIIVGASGVLTLRPDGGIAEGAGGGFVRVGGEIAKEAGLGGLFGDPNRRTSFTIAPPVEVASGGTLRVGSGRLNIVAGLTNRGTVAGRDTLAFTQPNGFFNPGTVAPGDGFGYGRLVVLGDYTAGTRTALEAAGDTPEANQDQLVVSGTAFLSGDLRVRFESGFTLFPGESITLIEAGAVEGTFATEDLPSGTELVYEPTRVLLQPGAGGGGSPLANSTWPMLGGGLRHENSAFVSGPTGLELDWTLDRSTFFAWASQPAIGPDGTIYTANVGDALFAITPEGQIQWSAEVGGGRTTPAVAQDGTIYYGSSDDNLYAFNPDGSEKWRFNTEGRINASPAIADDGTVYVASNGERLYAVSGDGTQKWSFNIGALTLSSPAVAADGTVLVGNNDGTVFAVNPDGTLRWTASYSGLVRTPTVTFGGTVVVEAGGGIVALELASGDEIWRRDGLGQFETPGFRPGLTPLTFAETGQTLHALNLETGATEWTLDVGDGRTPTTATLDGQGNAYVTGSPSSGSTSSDGLTVYVLNGQNGTVLSTTDLDDRAERAPILDGQGRLIVPVLDGLRAFTAASPGELTITPGALDFGEVGVGSSRTLALTLGNSGGSPLTVFDVYPDGSSPAFTDNRDGQFVIPAGESVTVQVTFTPDDTGSFSSALTIESDSQTSSFEQVPLSGTGVESAMPPIAGDDTATTAEDTAVTVQVLSNDSSQVSEPLEITATTDPASGTIALVSGGTRIRYTPEAGFNGTDTFTYTVTDSGGSDTATVTVTVTPVNDAPIAQDDAATTAEDSDVRVRVLDNDSDPDGDALTITAVGEAASGEARIAGDRIRYIPDPDFNGTDQFTYTVSDGNGGTDTATVTVTVTPVNDVPIARDDATSTGEGEPVTVSVLANDTDADGDALTISAVGTATRGTTSTDGETVTYTPEPGFTGTDAFTYTVSDGNGGTATATVTIEVSATAPIARGDTAATDEDTAVTVQVLANDESRVSEPLTIAAVTQPANGTAVIVANGTAVRYTPDADFNGTDTFTYRITDSGGSASAAVTVTVAPVNDAPEAQDDDATAVPNQPVTVAVLDNDSDPDGDALTVTEASGAARGTVTTDGTTVTYTPEAGFRGTDTFTYTVTDGDLTDTATVTVTVAGGNLPPIAQDDAATTEEDSDVRIRVLDNDADPDGDALTITAVGEAASGEARIAGTRIRYIPDDDFNGTDQFTYTVSDGNGGTDTATVTVTVTAVNDAPVARDDAATTAPNQPVTIAVLDNDSDPDTDAPALVSFTQPASGTVEQAAGQQLRYTPAAGFRGTDTFTYTITDGQLTDEATVTVTVTDENSPPVAEDDAAATDEDTPVTVAVLDNDSDPDGDALTVAGASGAASGTVTTDGTTVTYTPEADFNGTDTFTYTVSDGNGGDATATVTVTVAPVNDAPIARDDAATTPEATPVTVAVLANDSDVDGDALTVAAAGPAARGTVTTDGTTVTFTPEAGTTGAVSFPYTVTDGELTATATVTVTVSGANLPPVAVADTVRVRPGESVLVDVLANDSDPEGGALTLVSVQSPTAAGGTAAVESGAVRYTPPAEFTGEDSFTYTIADPQGATAQATVTVIAQPYRFALTDLGTLGGDRSTALAIASDGRIVGGAADGAGALRPTVWTNGTAAPVALVGDPEGLAFAVSGGVIAGVRYGASGEAEAFRTDVAGPLADPGGGLASAYGVASGGLAVGSASVPVGLVATAWDATGSPATLGPLADAGFARAEAFGIAASGGAASVVGYAEGASDSRAFRGAAVLPGAEGRAYATTPAGVTVGSVAGEGGIAAVRWTADATGTPAPPEALGGLGGAFAEAYAVNAAGWIVGAAAPLEAALGKRAPRGPLPLGGALAPGAALGKSLAVDTRAVLWVDGQALDLDALVAAPGWTLLEARGVNAGGLIVGTGLLNGLPRAFLLTPTDNAAPRALADRAEVASGATIEMDLTANDSDADGDALTVVAVEGASGGTVERLDGGVVRYTPHAGFTGEDTFAYTVADGRGGLAEGEVRVSVRAAREGLALAAAPNPASGAVTVTYALETAADVRLVVVDVLGREVATVAEGVREGGTHTARLDVRPLAPGPYVVRLVSGGEVTAQPLTVVR